MGIYDDVFPEFDDMVSSSQSQTRETGEREPPLSSGDWATTPLPGCELCPAHVSTGGTHDTVGTHYCNAIVAENPINPNYRYPLDIIRRMQMMIHYLQWIVGWNSAFPEFKVNGSAYNNFATHYSWEVVGASGQTLTLKVGGSDPREVVIYFAGGRQDIFDPLTFTQVTGSWCQPQDYVILVGNSVCRDRIKCKIRDFNFSGLPSGTADENDTFTITVDQDVSQALTKYFPESEEGVFVQVFRDAFHPELWDDIPELDPMFTIPLTVELTPESENWDVELGVIELLDNEGQPCRIAWPLADQEPYPWAPSIKSNIGGTFKIEIDYGSGYVDKTAELRRLEGGEYSWPNIVISHESGGSYSTKLYLGPIDFFGEQQIDYLADAVSVKIRYCFEVDDNTLENSFAPCEGHCAFDVEDYTKTIGGLGINGVGTSGSRHFFCAKRTDPNVTVSNLNDYRPNKCFLMTKCKGFRPATPPRVDELTLAKMVNGQNEILKQLWPSDSSITNFIFERCTTPSILWLLNPPDVYESWHQLYGLVTAFSGKYVHNQGKLTDEDGNESHHIVKGAVVNHNMTTAEYLELNWETNRIPTNYLGILPRRIPSNLSPLLPYLKNQVVLTTLDPTKQHEFWRLGRKVPGTFRDSYIYGSGLQFSSRDKPGLEGENRVQRFNRKSVVYVANVSLSDELKDRDQPNGDFNNAVVYSTEKTIFNHDDVRVKIKLQADGVRDAGRKRSGVGVNNQVHRMESLGDGQYKIHCSLGSMVASKVVVPETMLLYRFFASGNVVQLPHHYNPNKSYWNNSNDKAYGGPELRATIGDTVRFQVPGLSGLNFWVVYAEPSAGDDCSGIESDTWIQQQVVGSFFDFSEHFQGGDSPTIRIKNFYTKFMPSFAYQFWYGEGTPALNYILNADRPTDNQLDVLDLQNIYLEFDHFESAPNGPPKTISTIEKGIVEEDEEPFVFCQSVNHGLVTGDHIIISESDTDPPVDGTWRVTVLDADQFIFFTEIEESGTGALFTQVGGGDGVVIQGSHQAYLSFVGYYQMMLSSFGILPENRKMKVDYEINGVLHTKEVTINTPTVQLFSPGDTSKISEWEVWLFDPDHFPESPMVQLTFKGIVFTEFDYIGGPGYFQWCYEPFSNKVVLHPNVAGKQVYVKFKSTEVVDLGEFPPEGYVYAPVTIEDNSYLKKCDVLIIKDEDGIIEELGEELLNGATFYVSTTGVILHGETVHVFFAERETEEWTELPSDEFFVLYADGLIYLKQLAYERFESFEKVCFKIVTDKAIANRTKEMPAEVLKGIKAGIECLDTVVIEFAQSYLDTINISANWGYGFNGGFQELGPSVWWQDGTGTPIVGFQNRDLPIDEAAALANSFIYPSYENPLTAPHEYHQQMQAGANIFDAGSFGYNFILGSGETLLGALPGGGGAASFSSPIALFHFDHGPLVKLPTGTEIISAEIQVRAPDFFEYKRIKNCWLYRPSPTIPNDWLADDWRAGGSDPDPPIPGGVSSEVSNSVSVGWMIIGERNTGQWEAIQSFSEVSGTIQQGKQTVVSFKNTLEKMLELRNSDFRRIGYYVSNVAGVGFPIGAIDGVFDNAAVASILATGFHKYEYLGFNGATLASLNERFYFTTEAHAFGGEGLFGFSDLVIRFRLPSGLISTMRLPYGNRPSLYNKS